MTVRDDGRPPLSSTTRVVVQVEDVNDHSPVFEEKFYIVQIPATPSTDKPLFQVRTANFRPAHTAAGCCINTARFASPRAPSFRLPAL